MPCYYRKLSKGLRFYYSFTYNGEVHYSKCIYLSKKEAQRAERKKYEQLEEEERYGKKDKPINLKDSIVDRLKFLEVKYSKSHKINSEHYLNLFLDFIGDRDIRKITRKDVGDFLLDYSDKVTKSGLDNYQVNAALKTIKSLFNHIIDNHDLLIKNPCKGIKPYPIKKKLKYIPPDEALDKLKEDLTDSQRLLIDFLMETGARINEALALTYDDLKEDYIILYTRKSRNSDRVPRKVDFPPCLKGIKGKGRVFPDWNELPKFLDHTLRKNEMKIWGFHCLRHRYASKLLKAGVPLFDIMGKLGHSSLKTTQGYLQSLED